MSSSQAAVDRSGDPEVLGGQRAGPGVDQLQRGDAVGVPELAADVEQGAEIGEPGDRGDPMCGGGVQPQVEAGDHAEGALGADEQRREVVARVVAPHLAVTGHHRSVGQGDVEPEDLFAHVPVPHGPQPACIGRGHAADGGAVAGGEVDTEHQARVGGGPLHRCGGGPGSHPNASFDGVDGTDLGEAFGGQQHVVVFGHGARHQRRPAALHRHVRRPRRGTPPTRRPPRRRDPGRTSADAWPR